jgi:hypothetical protein
MTKNIFSFYLKSKENYKTKCLKQNMTIKENISIMNQVFSRQSIQMSKDKNI